jgi:hypothetical protein
MLRTMPTPPVSQEMCSIHNPQPPTYIVTASTHAPVHLGGYNRYVSQRAFRFRSFTRDWVLIRLPISPRSRLPFATSACQPGFFLGWQTELEWHSFQCFEVVHIASGC